MIPQNHVKWFFFLCVCCNWHFPLNLTIGIKALSKTFMLMQMFSDILYVKKRK